MTKYLLTLALALTMTCSVAKAEDQPLVETYPTKVTFLQAAIFFMFGQEGDAVTYGLQSRSEPVAWKANVTARAYVRDTIKYSIETDNRKTAWGTCCSENKSAPAIWDSRWRMIRASSMRLCTNRRKPTIRSTLGLAKVMAVVA
jgi:hypothetical protein